jgi:dolichol kinase
VSLGFFFISACINDKMDILQNILPALLPLSYWFDTLFKTVISLCIALMAFDKDTIVLIVMYVCLGDPICAIFGSSLGKWEEFKVLKLKNGKSVVGTLISFCFIYIFTVLYLFFYLPVDEKWISLFSMAISALTVIVELFTPWNDDISMSIISGMTSTYFLTNMKIWFPRPTSCARSVG